MSNEHFLFLFIFLLQISRNRWVSVSEFRGKVMVGIREFYEAEGELRPGKKGEI